MIKTCFLLILVSCFLVAHPHSFIDYEAEFCFESQGLCGIKTVWYFDDMFSSFVAFYDEDGDGKFNKQELSLLKEEAFDNLEVYNYFTKIYVNDNEYEVKSIKDFNAYFIDDIIVYEFFIPLKVEIKDINKEVVVMFFDPTYYIHVEVAQKEEPITFQGDDDYMINFSAEKRKQDAYYNGWIVPEAIKLEIKRKK